MRVAALDLGRRRVGIAVSDPSGTLATPWRSVTGEGTAVEVATRVTRVLRGFDAENPVSLVVVGLPVHLDGRPHDAAPRAQAVVHAMATQTGWTVVLQDERLTSVEAEQRLAAREMNWRKRKAKLDAAAAAVILQEYLDTPDRPSP
ncbi:MAG: Holliday junction resolvase RuvX [Acidobacteriota bacterium]|nr:Holliday junction resolvase RuvX [Acidobacteriota bacterium]